MGTLPLIFDTDIGTDIDDAVALAYLLKQPRCELLGITTVTGQAQARAALADAVCRAAGRDDVPIMSGTEAPLLGRNRQPTCQQAEILDRFDHRPAESFAPHRAVGWMREQIHARPHEITLLAVGPLTNVALLFAEDPQAAQRLRRLVWMGGVYGVGQRRPGLPLEHNASCDPTATAIVFNAPVAEHLSLGLDVTLACRLPNDDARAMFQQAGGGLAVVNAALDVWARSAPQIVFHDPLAAAAVFEPDLVTAQRGNVSVETVSPTLAGHTAWHRDPGGRHAIAVDVHAEAFLKHYVATVGGE
jgi:purine nucleosidase